MSITVNTKAYTQDIATSPNSVPYVGPANTLSVKDRIDLSRTAPKPTSTFSGMGRSHAKVVRTLTLTGAKTTTGDLTIDVGINVPVGAAGADVDSALSDVAAFLGLQSAKDLAKNLDLTA